MSLPISGFTAVPNPMMLSFLATQGFAIMYYGGAGWQFGKRKVSGMTNEQVNSMSPNDFLMRLHSETRTMVPTMAQGMKDMTPLVKTTLVLFGAYIREAIKAFPEVVQKILGSTDSAEFSNIPTSSGSSGTLPPQMASFLHYFATLSKATQGQVVAEAEYSLSDPPEFGDQTPGGFTKDKVKVRFEGKLMTVKDRETILRLRKDRLDKARVIQKKKFGSTTLPTAIGVRTRLVKRKAGQSQIMERNEILKRLRMLGLAITLLSKGEQYKSRTYSFKTGEFSMAKRELLFQQQKMVNLITRYRF